MTTEATAIRDAIVDRLKTLPGYKKPPRKVPLPQQQPTDLPQLSVFIMGERLMPDGDPEEGDLRFVSEVTIGISDMRGFEKPDVLDGQNDAAVDAIEKRLLTDASFTIMGPDALFEAVTGITRRRNYPQDGETYFAELRLEMTFRKRLEFWPETPDDLRHLKITTRPAGASPEAPPISSRIDLPGE